MYRTSGKRISKITLSETMVASEDSAPWCQHMRIIAQSAMVVATCKTYAPMYMMFEINNNGETTFTSFVCPEPSGDNRCKKRNHWTIEVLRNVP